MTEPEQPVAVPLRAALERLAAKRVEYLNAEERDSAAKDWQMADRARYIAAGIDIAVADLWPLVDGAALAVEAVRPETDIDPERLARAMRYVQSVRGRGGLDWTLDAEFLAQAYGADRK